MLVTAGVTASYDGSGGVGVALDGAGSFATAGAGSPVVCSGSTLKPGDSTKMMMHDGQSRMYMVHVPASYDGSRADGQVFNHRDWQLPNHLHCELDTVQLR